MRQLEITKLRIKILEVQVQILNIDKECECINYERMSQEVEDVITKTLLNLAKNFNQAIESLEKNLTTLEQIR